MKKLTLIVLAVGVLSVTLQAQSDELTAGNGTLYLGAFPNRIFVIDEATEQVTDEIQLQAGIPRRMSLSLDRTRFHLIDATFERFEIVDVSSKRSIDTFTLSEGNKKVLIRRFRVDPRNRFVIFLTRSTTKLVDRFEIGAPTLLQYDLTEHKVIRTIPWPEGKPRERVNMLFSPDGKLLYFFSDDVLIYETENFTQVDTWELSQPLEEGFGRLNFGFSLDVINEEPGFFTGLFRVQDPVQNRRLMGVARINLPDKRVDFYTLGPSEGVGFSLAPNRKRAYGLRSQIGRYEFWTFDLENKRLHSRREFAGRPRMAVKPSSNGQILYIYQAGNTIVLYDANTYDYLRTIALDGDMTTTLYVVPPGQ